MNDEKQEKQEEKKRNQQKKKDKKEREGKVTLGSTHQCNQHVKDKHEFLRIS